MYSVVVMILAKKARGPTLRNGRRNPKNRQIKKALSIFLSLKATTLDFKAITPYKPPC